MRSAAGRKSWLVVVLSVPGFLLVFAAARGQFDEDRDPPIDRIEAKIRRPAVPPPPRPGYVTVWSCLRCGCELGRGEARPTLAVCPGCGAPVTGFATSQVPAPSNATGVSTTMTVLVAVAIVELLLVGVLAYVLECRKRRRESND